MALALGRLVAAQETDRPDTTLVPRKAFFVERHRTDVRMSPNGATVGYLEWRDGKRVLCVTSLGDPNEPVAVPIEGDVRAWRWLTDRRIAAIAQGNQGTSLLLCEPGNVTPVDVSPIPGASYRFASAPYGPGDGPVVRCDARDGPGTDFYRVTDDGTPPTRLRDTAGVDVPERGFVLDTDSPEYTMLAQLRQGEIEFIDSSRDDSRWLLYYADAGPGSYCLWDRRTRQARMLFSDAPSLDTVPLALAARFAMSNAAAPLQMYLPPGTDTDLSGKPDRQLPAVLYVHNDRGIGLRERQRTTTEMIQFLASRGYVVVPVASRAYEAAKDELSSTLVRLADTLVARGITTAGKVAVIGYASGDAIIRAVAQSPGTFACGVALGGGGSVPVGGIVRPVLIVRGATDSLVAGENLTDVSFPKDTREVTDLKDWVAATAIVERFLHQHLGGPFELYGDALQHLDVRVSGAEYIDGLAEEVGRP